MFKTQSTGPVIAQPSVSGTQTDSKHSWGLLFRLLKGYARLDFYLWSGVARLVERKGWSRGQWVDSYLGGVTQWLGPEGLHWRRATHHCNYLCEGRGCLWP